MRPAPRRAGRGWTLIAMLALGSATAALAGGAEAPGPTGWVEVAAGEVLTLRAPPGTRFVPARGTDSLVGTFSGPGLALHLDYGLYSDSLQDARRTGQVTPTEIDGRAAVIITAERPDPGGTPRPFIALHVPAVTRSFIGPTRLTLTADLTEPDAAARAREVFATIRFSTRP